MNNKQSGNITIIVIVVVLLIIGAVAFFAFKGNSETPNKAAEQHEDGTPHTEGDSHVDESKPHVDVTPHEQDESVPHVDVTPHEQDESIPHEDVTPHPTGTERKPADTN